MKIDSNVVYKIGRGGLIDSKLIFIHPYKIKKRPWVARCFKVGSDVFSIDREFLDGVKEHYDDEHYLIEFDLDAYETYQFGNVYLGPNEDLYKSYAITSKDEFIELEFEAVLILMGKKTGKIKKEKIVPKSVNYAPDDIDF